MRLTTRPPNGIGLGQLAVEEDRLLDRVVARRGDDHERRAGILEQRADPAGALGEAVDHPAERAEEHRQVVQQVDAGEPLEQPEHHAGAAAEHPPADPAGRRNILIARPWKKPVSRLGASRKSSALRDGGVSSTSRS